MDNAPLVQRLVTGLLILLVSIVVASGTESSLRTDGGLPTQTAATQSRHVVQQHVASHVSLEKPFHSDGQRRLQGFQFAQESVNYGDNNGDYQPIRIRFLTEPMESIRGNDPLVDSTIDKIINEVLPAVQERWSSHLFLKPAVGPIPITTASCLDFDYGPLQPRIDSGGVENADLVIAVFMNLQASRCTASSLAFATPCLLDQVDRPIFGVINICKVFQQDAQQEELTDFKLVALHEVAHILGQDSRLFKYFRDSNTGEPLTPRPFTASTVQCVDGSTRSMVFPAQNTLQLGQSSLGLIHYEIVTPHVATVVRNHFDCQSLKGARLENQPTSDGDCTGTHWDERLFFNELMSAILELGGNVRDNVLSPLTLALMEDTGWYKVFYGGSQLLPFGHGRGCDFVNQDCIVNNQVPSYGSDAFCDVPLVFIGDQAGDVGNPIYCNPSHTSLALCELVDRSTAPSRFTNAIQQHPSYFDDSNLVTIRKQADFCPMPVQELENIVCNDENTDPRFQFFLEENYGQGSRCVNAVFEGTIRLPNETMVSGSFKRAACVPIVCDPINFRVIMADQVCEFDGQIIKASERRGTLVCPSLATVCPDLYCQGGCSGKGSCDYNMVPPQCVCFDTADTSPFCSAPSSGPTLRPVPTPSPTIFSNPSKDPTPFSSGSRVGGVVLLLSRLGILGMTALSV